MLAKINQLIFYRLPVLVYCIAIFMQSSFPATKSIPPFPMADKVLHLVGYALLGGLFLRALRTFSIRDNKMLIIFLSMILSSLYGISDEIHQSFVPERSADIYDALADTVGSIFGVLIYDRMTKISDSFF